MHDCIFVWKLKLKNKNKSIYSNHQLSIGTFNNNIPCMYRTDIDYFSVWESIELLFNIIYRYISIDSV